MWHRSHFGLRCDALCPDYAQVRGALHAMSALRDLPLSPEALLDLVGDIYEGPLEAEPWRSFAERLRRVSGARNVAITLHHPGGQGGDTYVMAQEADDDTDWEAVETVYRQQFMRDDPRRLELVQPGEIVEIDGGSISPEARDYLGALDIGQCLRTSFAEPGGMRCWIDIVRPLRLAVPFDATDTALLRTLQPHLVRGLRLYAAQKRQEAESAVYEDTIDHFVLGSVLLDGALAVMRVNRAAATIIDAHPGIAIVRARLRPANAAMRRELDAALTRALAASAGDGHERRGELVRLDTPGAKPLGLLVYPVTQARYYQGAHAPSVIVYLTDLAQKLDALQPTRESSQALVAQLFGLTPQEARLALLLADGCTLAAAAEQIGVAEAAARNYSKRIYAKMGIKGQSDIVRLVYRSFALLR
jgi:DNA-binding CsgD family transcriptional regulator